MWWVFFVTCKQIKLLFHNQSLAKYILTLNMKIPLDLCYLLLEVFLDERRQLRQSGLSPGCDVTWARRHLVQLASINWLRQLLLIKNKLLRANPNNLWNPSNVSQ